MKTLNYLKYFLFVVFGAALIISCSDDDSADDILKSNGEIELRNTDEDSSGGGDTDADCFVKICVELKPNNNFNFQDVAEVNVD